jgi:magnesium chelatase subunit I
MTTGTGRSAGGGGGAVPATVGQLRASGWADRTVKQEVAANAARRLPALETALLCGHDMILLGERGQAKSRILRSLVELLDERMPIIAGSEVNDHPYRPFSPAGRAALAEHGDDTPIAWVGRHERYAE